MAQGNEAAAGSRRGRSFERLEELCQKAAGTPPATFLGRVYGALMLPQNPNEIGRLLFVPRLKLLLVDGDFERSFKRKQASREAPFLPF